MYLMTYRRSDDKYISLSQLPVCIDESAEFLRNNWKAILATMPGHIEKESEWFYQGELSAIEFDHIVFNEPTRMQISIAPVNQATALIAKATR